MSDHSMLTYIQYMCQLEVRLTHLHKAIVDLAADHMPYTRAQYWKSPDRTKVVNYKPCTQKFKFYIILQILNKIANLRVSIIILTV